MRTPQTIEINQKLKIIKLGNQRFKAPGGYCQPTGYTFFHEEFGFLSFKSYVPYIPVGGRAALQSILDGGGFLNFDDCTWLQAM